MEGKETTVELERARCASIVKPFLTRFKGLEQSVVTRIYNQISNGLVPETYDNQAGASAETRYANVETIEGERFRCTECVRLNAGVHSSALAEALMEMVLDIKNG